MNAPLPPTSLVRHRFTDREVLEMIAHGLIDQRVELLDGEIYHLPEDGFRHISYTMALARQFMARLSPSDYFVGVQTTLRLSAHNSPSPDIYVLRGRLPDGEVPSHQILLVVDVADSSLKDDLTSSASRYARHDVREYWVVDVNAPALLIHRDPVEGAYPPPRLVKPEEAVTPLFVPDISIRIADIK